MDSPIRPSGASPFFALLEAAHAARAAADLATAGTSFTSSQCRIGYVLADAVNGKPQVEIAARTGLSPAATSTMLARLERAGVVWREENERDRRILLAGLTDMGLEQWSRASARCARFDASIAKSADLSPTALAHALHEIAQALPSEWRSVQMRIADAPVITLP